MLPQQFPPTSRPPRRILRALCLCGMLSNIGFAAEPQPPSATPFAVSAPNPLPAAQSPSLTEIAWGIIFQNGEPGAESPRQASERRDNLLSALGALRDENNKSSSAVSGQIGMEVQNLLRQVTTVPMSSDVGKSFAALEKLYEPVVIEQALTLAEQYRCPMHPDIVGKKDTVCPKCGMQLSAPVRLSAISLTPGVFRNTIKARVEIEAPLQVGAEVKAHLILMTLKGEPVTLDDLREVHTRKIHLLVIDGSLTDYHHIHPTPAAVPGRYDFSFTPQKPGNYRLWADLQPISTDVQEFAMALIISDAHAEPLQKEPDRLTSTAGGLQYTLSFDRPLKSGQPAEGVIHVAAPDGSGFTQLEPVMGAFAHIVGFREDRTTALHIHPEITRPLVPEDRGGPDMHFRFYAAKPGFYRLFVQVQRNGQQEFAPFNINVAEGPLLPGMQKNNCSSGRSSPKVCHYGIRITEITLPKRCTGTAHRCEDDGNPS
jgi:Heavy metal binding domain